MAVSRSLENMGSRDTVLSPDQKTLYVSKSNGTIDVFDVVTGLQKATWKIGDALGAISVSEDGSYLLVTDPRQPLIYQVSTDAGTKTAQYLGNGTAYVDIEIVDYQTAIMSGSNPSKLNLLTGAISTLSGSAYYSGNSILTEDNHLTLFGETGISNGPLHIYDDRSGTVVANGDSYQSPRSGFNYGVQAISEASNQVLQFIYYSSVNVYDLSLKYLRTVELGQNATGMVYDPTGKFLYIAFASDFDKPAAVVKYEASTFNSIDRYELPATSGTNSSTVTFGNNLVVTKDGSYIIVTDPGSGSATLLNVSATSIDGTNGRDQLTGGFGVDAINAGAGDDVLIGGLGNDWLDGGDGIDTVIISDYYRRSSISKIDDALVVVSTDGTDSASNIEVVRFNDGDLQFGDSEVYAQVLRAYDAVLGRQPDDAGLRFYVNAINDRGNSLIDVVGDLIGSAELQKAVGDLPSLQFIRYIYQNALGRDPDANGAAYYAQALDSGLSRSAFVVEISESAEHRALTKAQVAEGYFQTDVTYESIALLYDGFAGRLPDAGGLTYYAGKVKSGALTLGQVASDFAESSEFKAIIAGKANDQIVDFIYQNTLDRAADVGGRSFYTQQLDSGASAAGVLLDVSLSQEHYNIYYSHTAYGIDLL
jgi:Ca2+-binding RTX toxin-like protein